ncbi:LIM domain-binding protein 1-like [Scleropages formosus]|uniref:LIM domain-binding protein 1-like n=1 Tax=Scleropages formosus TaxID=113540 RepID=A0A0P7WP77_SCLFO|nr:LIM domain-binding protein 1-like [Scleropages formosus]
MKLNKGLFGERTFAYAGPFPPDQASFEGKASRFPFCALKRAFAPKQGGFHAPSATRDFSQSFKLYSPKEPPNGSAFPPFHPSTMLDRDVGPTPMYPPTYLEPGIGRHTPYGNQTDYRIFELNKRLQNWTEVRVCAQSLTPPRECGHACFKDASSYRNSSCRWFPRQECDNLWWDAFTTEFFEDDAMLTITFCLEDGPKRYTIGRTLIPRYFRSIFEGGATELYYVLKHPKESFHNNFVSLDCDQCTMVTQNGKPMFTQVCVEGRLYLEFMFDDMMRIKTWHFSIRQHRELIPRSILAMHAQDPQMLDQLSKNITRCGLSNSTLNYLRELMSRHKTYSLSPRDCLKTCLFQKWQRMVAPPAEPARQAPNKRRKRKMSGGSTMSAGGGSNSNSNSKKKSPAGSFALSSQDVMVVGEPTLMGGEFGDEDERLITRLENTQFDAANGIDDEDSFNNSPALGANSPWNNKAPSSQESKNDNPTSQASQ